MTAPRVFTIPANAPFLPTLAARLLAGDIVGGFPRRADPLDLSRATIYLPTRRAAQAFRHALTAASGAKALALPKINALGDFENAEADLLLDPEAGPPEAVGDFARRMALATLIRAFAQRMKEAIVDEAGARGPTLVAATPAQAFQLAGALGELIDEMTIEGVEWGRLDALAEGGHDLYWGFTLKFLKIAAQAWPQWLAEHGLIDRVARGARLIEAEIARLGAPGAGPMIVAGSTGTNSATASLMRALAGAPQGAVVLPDFDASLDEASLTQILASDAAAASASGHPQAAMLRLLATMGVRREQVVSLAPATASAPAARGALLSEAMRPSETTEFWRRRRDKLSDEATAQALAGVSLIVAEGEVEESLAIAIALRETLETPGATAALVTPDASLSRRVAADLARFGIACENAADASLAAAPLAAFARLALRAALSGGPKDCAALIRHPLFALAQGDDLDRARRALDIGVFRRVEASVKGALDATEIAAARAAAAKRAHPALEALGEADWQAAAALATSLRAEFDAFGAAAEGRSLADLLRAHRALVWRLAALADDRPAEAQEALGELFRAWGEAVERRFECPPQDYSALFDEAVARRRWASDPAAHPRVKILGLLEARLLSFDRVILGGLDETTWPPAPGVDAFLNRAMRAELGLSSPERRIGQTAHDFVSALGACDAILTRSTKRDRAPTLPSRFLLRLQAVAGEAFGAAEARGRKYRDWARALDRPAQAIVIAAPNPRPPVALRPVKFSVTRVETLLNDPYAVFARSILQLEPLDPVGKVPGPRENGEAWHRALQRLVQGGETGEAARTRLLELLREAFAPTTPEGAFEALKWPELRKTAEYFLKRDAEWRADGPQIATERDGAREFTTPGGLTFSLSARADRIDRLPDGTLRFIDYKTGAPPKVGAVAAGWAPQMTLETALALRQAFAGFEPPADVEALYLKLGGGEEGGALRPALGKRADNLLERAEDHLAKLGGLVEKYAKPETPYLSHRRASGRRIGDYDHLARVAEWSAGGDEDDEAADGGGA